MPLTSIVPLPSTHSLLIAHTPLALIIAFNFLTACAIWVSCGILLACISRSVLHSHEGHISSACPTLTRCVLSHCFVFSLSIDLLAHMDFNTCRLETVFSVHLACSYRCVFFAPHLPWRLSYSFRCAGGIERYFLHFLPFSRKQYGSWSLVLAIISMSVCCALRRH